MKKNIMRALSALTLLVGLYARPSGGRKRCPIEGQSNRKRHQKPQGCGLISWNTYSSVDPTIFSHNLYSEKLTVLKSGHYFVSATLPIESAVGQRATQRALLKVNGNAGHQYALGQSSYARNSGHTEGSLHFNVFDLVKEGDVLTLDAQDIAGNANNRFLRTASLFVEKVEGNETYSMRKQQRLNPATT